MSRRISSASTISKARSCSSHTDVLWIISSIGSTPTQRHHQLSGWPRGNTWSQPTCLGVMLRASLRPKKAEHGSSSATFTSLRSTTSTMLLHKRARCSTGNGLNKTVRQHLRPTYRSATSVDQSRSLISLLQVASYRHLNLDVSRESLIQPMLGLMQRIPSTCEQRRN